MAVDEINKQLRAQQQQMLLLEQRRKEDQARRAIGVYRDTLAKIVLESFVGASKYANLVMAIGYAGFFAIWNGVRSAIYVHSVILSALFMGASLAIFVFFEIGKAQLTFKQQMKFKESLEDLTKAMEEARFEVVEEIRTKLETSQAEMEIRGVQRAQYYFNASIFLAVLGIISLVAGMFAKLCVLLLPA